MTAPSVPVPRTALQLGDFLTSMMLCAPDFSSLQRVVSYTVTYEMMLNAFREGLQQLPARNKSPEVVSLLAQCLAELDGATLLFEAGRKDEGRKRVVTAYGLFEDACRAMRKKKTPPAPAP